MGGWAPISQHTLAGEHLRQHRAIEVDFPTEVARFVEAADIKRSRPQWRWWRWPALGLAATNARWRRDRSTTRRA